MIFNDFFIFRLTKLDYQTTRNGAMRKGSKLYPAYNNVQEEKKKYIPDSSTQGEFDGITAGDYHASFDLHYRS